MRKKIPLKQGDCNPDLVFHNWDTATMEWMFYSAPHWLGSVLNCFMAERCSATLVARTPVFTPLVDSRCCSLLFFLLFSHKTSTKFTLQTRLAEHISTRFPHDCANHLIQSLITKHILSDIKLLYYLISFPSVRSYSHS